MGEVAARFWNWMAEYSSYMWSVPDWRSDDVYDVLDNRGKGIYRELIDQCWVAGSITSDPAALARFVGEPADYFIEVWNKIRRKFRTIENGERLVSKRLEEDRRRLETVRTKRKKIARIAAEKRWKDSQVSTNNDNEFHASSMLEAQQKHAQNQNQTHREEVSSLLHSPNLQTGTTSSRGERARKTRAPAELAITDSMFRWAEDNGLSHVNLKTQTEAMLDHFRGTGEARSDWTATWRSWMRRVDQFARRSGGANGRPKESYSDRVARENRETAARFSGGMPDATGDGMRPEDRARAGGSLLPRPK